MFKHRLLILMCMMLAGNLAMSQELIHYWNFNNTTDLVTPASTKGGAALTYTLGANGSTDPSAVLSGTGGAFGVNSRNGDAAAAHFRFNCPAPGEMVFSLPTTGYSDPVVKYETYRSGQGATEQTIYYSTDGTNYTILKTVTVTTTAALVTCDLSSIAEADNNPNLKVKIKFAIGAAGNTEGNGNNRIDNFTLDAFSAGADVNAPTVTFAPVTGATNLPVNSTFTLTFNEDIRLAGGTAASNANIASALDLKLNDVSGNDVAFTATINGKVVTITPSVALQNNQTYYVGVKANAIEDLSANKIVTATGISVKTIAVQTVFTAGDIVIVAYRTSTSDKADAFAFLSLVDILPGTNITFTDGKYTNAGTQCTGGLIWTAPAAGVKKGDVVVIENDNPSAASVGTLTGSGFGLSSGGDQVMAYTGDVTSPAYITAFSSNAWVADKPDCSGGSTSKLPAVLTDGQSSINLSTAPGNVSGLSANAYYTGSQSIKDITQLKASILNPANWTATAGSTPAQTWPVWAFLKEAPIVTKAEVINAFTIRLIFDRDLDNTTATDAGNFTGISGLDLIARTNNGSAPDTVTLTYATAFASGASNTLTVNNVKDASGNVMTAAYTFSFTYNSAIAFDKAFYTVKEDAGSVKVSIKLTNPATSSVDVVVKTAPWSTASANDFTLSTQTLNFTGSSNNTFDITIPVTNDNTAENDEYFVLSLENVSGAALGTNVYATVYIKDNDKKAPVATEEIEMEFVTSFDPSSTASTTEAISYDPQTKRIFAISAIQDRVDIIDFANPAAPVTIKAIDMSVYGGVTSIAAKNGVLAVGSPNANEQLNGSLVLFDIDGNFKKQLTVGALPDFVCFTPDGSKIMTANEGQPSNDYTVDPEGSVSVVNIAVGLTNVAQSDVTTISLATLNANEAALIASGIRKTKASSTLAQDLEPEYITVAPDSKKAWVSIQENNAMMELNLETLTITDIWALGTKDYSQPGNGIDVSTSNGEVLIANWPVKGYYMPDAIANYTVGGKTYLVTANEGDEKEYAGLNATGTERAAVSSNAVILDPAKFPNAAVLKQTHNLGNFRISNLQGNTDTDNDYDELYAVGSRSFSIFDAATKTKVYDSGDDFEYIIAQHPVYAPIFNSNHEENKLKGRSNAKGCEPEAAAVATLNGKEYAFIGLERVGGVMAYNVTDPANPVFVDYKNSRNVASYGGDNGPEYIVVVPGKDSPDGKSYILVSNEISGTIAVFKLNGVEDVTTDLDDKELTSNFYVYPNPVKGTRLNLSKTANVKIETINGQKVTEADNTNSVDISHLSSGLYILKTSDGEVRKFIVE